MLFCIPFAQPSHDYSAPLNFINCRILLMLGSKIGKQPTMSKWNPSLTRCGMQNKYNDRHKLYSFDLFWDLTEKWCRIMIQITPMKFSPTVWVLVAKSDLFGDAKSNYKQKAHVGHTRSILKIFLWHFVIWKFLIECPIWDIQFDWDAK